MVREEAALTGIVSVSAMALPADILSYRNCCQYLVLPSSSYVFANSATPPFDSTRRRNDIIKHRLQSRINTSQLFYESLCYSRYFNHVKIFPKNSNI